MLSGATLTLEGLIKLDKGPPNVASWELDSRFPPPSLSCALSDPSFSKSPKKLFLSFHIEWAHPILGSLGQLFFYSNLFPKQM